MPCLTKFSQQAPDSESYGSHERATFWHDRHLCQRCHAEYQPHNRIEALRNLCTPCYLIKRSQPTAAERKALKLKQLQEKERAKEEKRINREAEKQLKAIEKEKIRESAKVEKARAKEMAKLDGRGSA